MAKIERKHLFPRPAHRICKNCKWWEPSAAGGECESRTKIVSYCLFTEADFGCNQWKEKD